jgi:hypothetical protein
VLQQALELEADERALVAAELMASLEESDVDVERAWATEIDRRSRQAASEPGEDWRADHRRAAGVTLLDPFSHTR